MNSTKNKITANMTMDQKTMLTIKIPYINMFRLSSTYENKINLISTSQLTGSGEEKNNEYNNEYNGKTGKFKTRNKITISIGYNVDRYSFFDEKGIEDKKYKFIDLITIKNKYRNNIHCGSIAIETKTKKATITSLGNSSKCLLSADNKTEFKYGDILFQIMLNICKKENIEKIEITDNSYVQCGNINLCLDYIKTLTHGFTHYHKYGFKYKYDPDNQILKDNYKHFLTAPTIKANKIISLLEEKNIDKKTIEKIKKLFEMYEKDTNSDDISVKKFIKFYINDLSDVVRCAIIEKIYIDLYTLSGYKPHLTKDYFLYV